MESKKDIGKLFRDNLEQLDFTPSTKVWEQIELDLSKKKKKRRFIIWFFFAGIITIGMMSGLIYTFSDGNLIKDKSEKETTTSNENTIQKNTNAITEKANSNTTPSEETQRNNDPQSAIGANAVDKNPLHKNGSDYDTILKSKLQKKKAAQSNQHFTNAKISQKKKKDFKKNRTLLTADLFTKNQKKDNRTLAENQKEATASKLQNETQSNTTKTIESTEKQTVVDSLIVATQNKTTNTNKKPKDSLAVKDTVADVKEKSKGYEIVVAPYYGLNYGSYFGEFDALSNNTILEQKSAMRATYGVLVRWMFGGKWGVQTGFGKINSRYFSTIEKTGSTFINTQNVATDIPVNELNGLFVNETKVKFTYDSSYLEVPLEAYYVVRDKKLGIATSFGLSFLFGNKNSVFAESDLIQKIKIGTLTTNAPISGTLNGKLYLFYKITPSLHLDLYPTFQYQIMGNTDSSNYSGYFFSLRTGLSYKF